MNKVEQLLKEARKTLDSIKTLAATAPKEERRQKLIRTINKLSRP